MTERFLDTNILLYSISREPTETAKRDRAIALLDADDNALSVQVLQEFYVQATRPTRPDALRIKAVYGFSYWDAAIVAASRALGCRELYSEDMTHGREVEGTIIINPFR